MVELYRDSGLDIYEKVHYSNAEHTEEVEQILKWYHLKHARVLDIGCSGGLHALEFARRGFSVTGFDIEPSAIDRAGKRCRDQGLKAEFHVLDVENDDLSSLGSFDLIYSLGNVMSHIRKYRIYHALRKIRECLNKNGIFLFNVLITEPPFQEEIHAKNLKIHWKRMLNRQTGEISMVGNFLEFGITQHFAVWGYYVNEVHEVLQVSGFKQIDLANKLDFSSIGSETKNPISLYFRITKEKELLYSGSTWPAIVGFI